MLAKDDVGGRWLLLLLLKGEEAKERKVVMEGNRFGI